jgi:hypothetical protein
MSLRLCNHVLARPIDPSLYEGAFGSSSGNHGLPRFQKCGFTAANPLAQVMLSDLDMPVDVTLQAFNPLVPGDAEVSGHFPNRITWTPKISEKDRIDNYYTTVYSLYQLLCRRRDNPHLMPACFINFRRVHSGPN